MSQPLVNALRFLKDAAKTMVIASALILISLAMFIASPWMMISAFLRYTDGNIIMGWLIFAAILALLSLILIFISIYGMLIHSAYYFATYKKELRIVRDYIKWGFIMGLVLAVVGFLLYGFGFIMSPLAVGIGLPLLVIGIFMLWLGGIGLSVLCFRLYEEFKSVSMLVAGIFFLIMGAISLISWVLIHIETRGLMVKVRGKEKEEEEEEIGKEVPPSAVARCPYCGSEIPSGSRKCPVCGLEIPPPPPS